MVYQDVFSPYRQAVTSHKGLYVGQRASKGPRQRSGKSIFVWKTRSQGSVSNPAESTQSCRIQIQWWGKSSPRFSPPHRARFSDDNKSACLVLLWMKSSRATIRVETNPLPFWCRLCHGLLNKNLCFLVQLHDEHLSQCSRKTLRHVTAQHVFRYLLCDRTYLLEHAVRLHLLTGVIRRLLACLTSCRWSWDDRGLITDDRVTISISLALSAPLHAATGSAQTCWVVPFSPRLSYRAASAASCLTPQKLALFARSQSRSVGRLFSSFFTLLPFGCRRGKGWLFTVNKAAPCHTGTINSESRFPYTWL